MYLVSSGKLRRFDKRILYLIQEKGHNPIFDRLMPFVTGLGNLGAIWIGIAFYMIIREDHENAGTALLTALVLGTVMGEGILKNIIRRIRPCFDKDDDDLLIKKPTSYSFPSGHTLSSFSAAGVLTVFLPQYCIIFWILAFLIAYSRLYLNVHYPTDVIAGIIFGLLSSWIVIEFLQSLIIERIAFALKI